MFDPDVIVLGCGLSKIARPLHQLSARRWGEFVFSDRVDILLVPLAHGDTSGVRA